MVVTMMPSVAEALGAPRIVGVEFPFGHAFGMAHDHATHAHVLAVATRLLSGATRPGTRVDIDLEWPIDTKTAYRAWQPAEPSPLVAQMIEQIRMRRASGEDAG